MTISFHLRGLPSPRLTEDLIREPLVILQRITRENLNRFAQGEKTPAFQNRKAELIRRLKDRRIRNERFEQATDVIGREQLLLSIYLENLGQKGVPGWLPNFDEAVAQYVLGNNGSNWHIGRRWQVLLLFFEHFDRLSGLSFVCERIRESFTSEDLSSQFDQIRKWYACRDALFHPDGPSRVAGKMAANDELTDFMARFAIPKEGRYSEILRQELLLNQLKRVSFGREFGFFSEIESQKESRVTGNLLLGSAALKIIIRRIVKEGNGRWPDKWRNWITRFGCDPRYGRKTEIVAKWWFWATDSEYRLAIQGVNALTIHFFIGFLKNSLVGTGKESQFRLRSRFLLALFDSGKIEHTRMIVNHNEIFSLHSKYRNPLFVAKLLGSTSHTSMICLKCTNDIFIIEGTHDFALRAFHHDFPVFDFWNRPKESYQDKDLRISRSRCPVFLRHDPSGSWASNFFYELRSKFHVEWRDVKI